MMEKVVEFFKRDKFAEDVGVELLECSPGYAKAQLKITDKHLNSVGLVHGGAIFALGDLVFAVSCNSHGTVAVAINVSISFIKAVKSGVLTAEAREVAINPKIGSYKIDITNEEGEIVAVFQGLAYRKKESI